MFILLAPILEFVLFTTAVALLFVKRLRMWAVLTLCLCLLLNYSIQLFALNFCSFSSDNKGCDIIRVLTYNIKPDSTIWARKGYEDDLIMSISKLSADVLVICEVDCNKRPKFVEKIRSLYPYSNVDIRGYKLTDPILVFSKYEIDRLENLVFTNTNGKRKCSLTDYMVLKTNSGDIEFAACHFVSNNLNSEENTTLKSYNTIRNGYGVRKNEVDALRNSLEKCNLPKIIAGDFNDIGGSYTLRHLFVNDIADAWWEGGLGFGFTHEYFLRLDHILYSKDYIELCGIKVLNDWKYSDHYPLVADFKMKN